MLRFIWFLILLLAGCALIFWPYQVMQSADPGGSSRSAQPVKSTLPPAWQRGTEIQVRPLPSPIAGQGGVESSCADTYTVRPGDTLGEIARRCGLSLAGLLAANPQVRDPDRIETGSALAIPVQTAGGIPDTSRAVFTPGAEVELEAGGLPPNRPVRIGLGLSGSGYQVLAQAVTGPDGRLVARVSLPAGARPGDSAFLLVTTQGVPSAQAISETFTIAAP